MQMNVELFRWSLQSW